MQGNRPPTRPSGSDAEIAPPSARYASRSRLLAAALILCLATAGAAGTAAWPDATASGSVTNIVITDTRSPTFEGMSYGDVGPYEHLFGYVEGELDPTTPATPGSSTWTARHASRAAGGGRFPSRALKDKGSKALAAR